VGEVDIKFVLIGEFVLVNTDLSRQEIRLRRGIVAARRASLGAAFEVFRTVEIITVYNKGKWLIDYW
jgi:hypothetical protein